MEGDLEQCWRCNKARKVDFYIFKKLSVGSFTFSLLPRDGGSTSGNGKPYRQTAGSSSSTPTVLITQDTPLECSITLRRSLYDINTRLGLEIDLRMDRLKMRLAKDDGTFGHFVAFMMGFGECLSARHAIQKVESLGSRGLSSDRLQRAYSSSSSNDTASPGGGGKLRREMSAMFDLGTGEEEEGAVVMEEEEEDDDGKAIMEDDDDDDIDSEEKEEDFTLGDQVYVCIWPPGWITLSRSSHSHLYPFFSLSSLP